MIVLFITAMRPGSTVLLVDDSMDDVFFFTRLVKKHGYPFRIEHAKDGVQAIEYLEGKGEFADRKRFPLPRFIISDNQMPRMTGRELLRWLRDHPQLSVVPTIFFSGPSSAKELNEAYDQLGVHSVIYKPQDNDTLERYVKLIFDYWSICALPTCSSTGEPTSPAS